MKYAAFVSLIVAMAMLPVGGALATGKMTCESGDKSTWKSKDALREKITADGWKVRRVKVDGGCYEVYGKDPEGRRVEAYFDPLTLEKLLVERRGKILFKKGETEE